MTLVIGKPLNHDKEVHIAKDHHQEDQLGQELMKELISLIEVY